MPEKNNGTVVWVRWVIGGSIIVLMAVLGVMFSMVSAKIDEDRYIRDMNTYVDSCERRLQYLEKRISDMTDRSDHALSGMDRKMDVIKDNVTAILIRIGEIDVRLKRQEERRNGTHN